MTDLTNNFPSWGETGTYPNNGFFYQGGDQVNEKHLDALWNGIEQHVGELITGIEERVSNIEGDIILGTGLKASQGTNSLEVDISAELNGAYVDGQFTGSIASTTISLSSNSTGSTETWYIVIGEDGGRFAYTDPNNIDDNQHKITEVDVDTNDNITDIRNTGRHVARHFTSENPNIGHVPGGQLAGDLWFDDTSDRLKIGDGNGSWDGVVDGTDTFDIFTQNGLSGGKSEGLVGGASFYLSVDAADIEADNLAGANGTGGEVLTTDGSNASWEGASVQSFSSESNITGLSESDIAYVADTSRMFLEDGT